MSSLNHLVTVIITTYKRPDLLRRSISSVLNQTYSNLQIVVVNDDPESSYSNTDFSVWDDSRLQFINHSVNKGVSFARNTGLNHSIGDFICFLDDDDIWLADKVEKQLRILAKTPLYIGFTYCWSYVLDASNNVTSHISPNISGNIFDLMLLRQCIPNISTIMIKSYVLNEVSGFEVSLMRGNDSDFLRKLSFFYHVIPTQEFLVYYSDSPLYQRITNFSRGGLTKSLASLEYRKDRFKHELSFRPYTRNFLDVQLMSIYFHSNQYIKGFKIFTFAVLFYAGLQLRLFYRLIIGCTSFPHD
ncbi:glycosyltransferase family 2 protein [Parasynechococcus marenigrum]|uniref:Possible glycosyltransferase n=1 Tax=Parasynechococcus marenigrum (strain WH8102) TaxID=84588 RepID=Q7U906_PARMW|nr:Possible glycosyltransferase [Parasynechococcus marenigrum WH 8102]